MLALCLGVGMHRRREMRRRVFGDPFDKAVLSLLAGWLARTAEATARGVVLRRPPDRGVSHSRALGLVSHRVEIVCL
jgi:hypothetical protein